MREMQGYKGGKCLLQTGHKLLMANHRSRHSVCAKCSHGGTIYPHLLPFVPPPPPVRGEGESELSSKRIGSKQIGQVVDSRGDSRSDGGRRG